MKTIGANICSSLVFVRKSFFFQLQVSRKKNQFSLPNHNAPIVEVSKKEEEEKEEETNNFSLPTKCTQNAESESELGINRNRKKI